MSSTPESNQDRSGPLLQPAGELPPYTATQLGPERAALARELRLRLRKAGLLWPDWIDARPGLLQVVVGDCSDAPLGHSAATLVSCHGELLLDGIAALALVTAAPRRVLCSREPATVAALRALCAERSVEVVRTAAGYPSCPELDVPGALGHSYTVPAAQLARIGALVRGVSAPSLCTVAGTVQKPQTLELAAEGGEPAVTPTELVRRCGGALPAAWVALAGGALSGVLWPQDEPLPARTELLLILPVAHELVSRLRRDEAWQLRARNACLSCRACTDFCPEATAGAPFHPHLLMRSLARAEAPPPMPSACTGCGMCSVVCPAELLPGAALIALARSGADQPPAALIPPLLPADRRLPAALLLARLGLSSYAAPDSPPPAAHP